MKELVNYLNDIETVKVFVPLITGIVVLLLSTFYNHSKERRLFIKSQDTELSIRQGQRFLNKPVNKEITTGKHTLLISKRHHRAKVLNKEKLNETKAIFLLIENIAEKRIFNIRIRNSYVNNGRQNEFFNQFHMDPDETFYIFASLYDEERSALNVLIRYKTLAGKNYGVYNRVFTNKFFKNKFTGIRMKYRILFFFIPLPIEFALISRKYKNRSRLLLKK